MSKVKIRLLSRLMAFLMFFSVLNLGQYKVKAFEGEVVPLYKYGTQTPIQIHQQNVYIPKYYQQLKRQFRTAWVSTVTNLDFPSRPGLTEEEFKQEYLKILDEFEELNFNAITVQVRPKLDAFYKSDLNPWSEYLTGVQGKDPGWDPLEWMIKVTHERNMEFHAWFNPYRVTNTYEPNKTIDEILATLADNNWAKMHPQYVLKFDGKLLLNPGEPEVINYIKESIVEVVQKYDVDAIHFDDYFYPYKVTRNGVTYYFGDANEDLETFQKYGQGFTDIKDWRRNNVNTLIKEVSKAIKEKKPYVKFGISPFGIWGHYDKHPEGSAEGVGSHTPITSSASYDDIYADTRKWVKEGWIDYITPQIYWAFGTTAAPYGELVDWWADVVKGTNCHLYIGHANYKINSNDNDWKNPEEIGNQLKFNLLYNEVKGSSFFSLKQLRLNNLGDTDKIKNDYFKTKAFVPAMPWIDDKAPNKVQNVSYKLLGENKIEVLWKDDFNNDSTYYAVYRFEGKSLGNIENPSNVIGIVRRDNNKEEYSYIDNSADKNKQYVYAVTAFDRLHNESRPELVFYPKVQYIKEKIMLKDIINNKIELEYRGYLDIAQDVLVYQILDNKVIEKSLSDVMVGAENVTLYLNKNNQVDLIIIDGETKIDKIRIGIRSDVNNPADINLLDYLNIEMKASSGFKLIDKKSNVSFDILNNDLISFKVEEGKISVYKNGNLIYKTLNRLYAEPINEDEKITVTTLRRGSPVFNPSYRGTLEITLSKNGDKLNLINEIQIEKYLYQVVPSEMPASFGLEALKAQAVAARTYALGDYFSSRFADRGFHVDDSTLSQVYNNTPENPTATQAVNETKGMVMKNGDQLVDARYYSTSGGYSAAKHEVWSEPVSNMFPGIRVPYLIGRSYTFDPQDNTKLLTINTQDEKEISEFYKNISLRAYDSDSAWFRWKLSLSKQELQNTINSNIKLRYEADPQFILTKDSDGNFISKPIPEEGTGEILNMYVAKRGEGGNITELVIVGTTGTYKIVKEFNIRFIIRPRAVDTKGSDVILYRATGGSQDYNASSLKNYSILPSAFFTFDTIKDENNNLISVVFYGGGNGHGVGMSQYGAKGLSDKGWTYDKILMTYYTNVELVNVYNQTNNQENNPLKLLILMSEDLFNSADEGKKQGNYLEGSKAKFRIVIDKAVNILKDENLDKDLIESTTDELKAAMRKFIDSKVSEEQANQYAKEQAAIDAIASLPDVENLTLEDEDAIKNARSLVNIANNDSNIVNLNKLIALEEKLLELKNKDNKNTEESDKNNEQNNQNESIENLPKTGQLLDANILVLISFVLILCGISLLLIRKKKDNI
ncbi:family 10 glycosylhydrolase [Caloramator proteoclasticus]|uniref:SpoIID/LytB domain protein n=1 Tax=Caloramator proteoclasticus DSM 10124 TaxID=1121262 RepID=A0A1M4T308_9CLOT|nr:family 10 glycosylhydrolase [Caloramator proteoclasticus]SHE38839.1 SpoIID/LytB domain protein [Caloramator proteoclasticus DSM 10124]